MNFAYVYRTPAPGARLFIDLPAEIITYFQISGMTEVSGTINNIPFQCGLLPRGKGNFSISFTKQLQKRVNANDGDILEIDLKVISKPEYKLITPSETHHINKIELVMQNKSTTCGQACIAMLSGKNIEQVIADMHTSGPTTIGQLIEILDIYKINHAPKNVRISKKKSTLPNIAILTLHFQDYSHFSLYYHGKYYDPEYGLLNSLPKHARVTSFLEIYMT